MVRAGAIPQPVRQSVGPAKNATAAGCVSQATRPLEPQRDRGLVLVALIQIPSVDREAGGVSQRRARPQRAALGTCLTDGMRRMGAQQLCVSIVSLRSGLVIQTHNCGPKRCSIKFRSAGSAAGLACALGVSATWQLDRPASKSRAVGKQPCCKHQCEEIT